MVQQSTNHNQENAQQGRDLSDIAFNFLNRCQFLFERFNEIRAGGPSSPRDGQPPGMLNNDPREPEYPRADRHYLRSVNSASSRMHMRALKRELSKNSSQASTD